jgi:leader peptidase (prepilin peptidase)/N-methyltransferase
LLTLLATFALAPVLARLTWIDIRTFRLPDIYTLPLIIAGLILAMQEGGVGLAASVVGGLVGFTLFWGVGHMYFTRRGVEGLGLGDAKLFAASGTWLGYTMLPYVLLVASLSGLVFAIVCKPAQGGKIAFGPWLCLAFLVVWLGAQFSQTTVLWASVQLR